MRVNIAEAEEGKTSEEQVSQHSGELAHEPELDVGDDEEDDGHNDQSHVVLP